MASDDIASVTELLDAAARADGRRPLSDHLYLDLVNGGLDGFAGFLASEPGHDHPVAYAQISRGNDAHAFELVIHPHHRYEMATIGPELIEAAIDVVAADGGGRVNWWVFEPTAAHSALADAAHMTRGRTLHQMRRSLPTGMDVTIETRSFVPAPTMLRGSASTIERSPTTASRADGRSTRSASASRSHGSIRTASGYSMRSTTTATSGWPGSAGRRSTRPPTPAMTAPPTGTSARST